MGTEPFLLRLSQVSKSYPTGGGTSELTVLRGIDLELRAGESLSIVGPSGSGKSTLLNIIGSLDKPTSGTVQFGDRDLTTLSEVELAHFRNREIGFIFQGHHLLPQCTVLENVLVPTIASRDQSIRTGAADRGKALLKRVGLGDRLDHRPGQLSGGERQRVAVVRALINKPKLLLADEPTGALDWVSAASLGELLMELNAEEAVSLIMVTHALDLAKKTQAQFELREGRLSRMS